jgi:chromate reductase, NAD(P)H dehydrogenase (quinone)
LSPSRQAKAETGIFLQGDRNSANMIGRRTSLALGAFMPYEGAMLIYAQDNIPMASPKILVFSGSGRAGSVNTKLATLVSSGLKAAGAVVTQISLADYPLPFADATGFGNPPPHAIALRDLLDSHDGVFIASPEYNGGYTALLKNALDWMSIAKPGTPASTMAGKVVAVGGASPGHMGGYRGITQLRTSLELGFGALVIPEMVAVGMADTAFAEDGSLNDARTAGFLNAMTARLIKECSKHM